MNTYSQFLTDEQFEHAAGMHLVSSGITTYHRGTKDVLKESGLLENLNSSTKNDWELKIKSQLELTISKAEQERSFDDTEFSVLWLALFAIQSPSAEEIKQKLFVLDFPSRSLTWMKAEIRWVQERGI